MHKDRFTTAAGWHISLGICLVATCACFQNRWAHLINPFLLFWILVALFLADIILLLYCYRHELRNDPPYQMKLQLLRHPGILATLVYGLLLLLFR